MNIQSINLPESSQAHLEAVAGDQHTFTHQVGTDPLAEFHALPAVISVHKKQVATVLTTATEAGVTGVMITQPLWYHNRERVWYQVMATNPAERGAFVGAMAKVDRVRVVPAIKTINEEIIETDDLVRVKLNVDTGHDFLFRQLEIGVGQDRQPHFQVLAFSQELKPESLDTVVNETGITQLSIDTINRSDSDIAVLVVKNLFPIKVAALKRHRADRNKSEVEILSKDLNMLTGRIIQMLYNLDNTIQRLNKRAEQFGSLAQMFGA